MIPPAILQCFTDLNFMLLLRRSGDITYVPFGPLGAPGLQVSSSTYSSRSNYVRVNAKRTYILLVHGALRWYIVLTYLPCVARWPAPPGVLTCSKNVARLRRAYLYFQLKTARLRRAYLCTDNKRHVVARMYLYAGKFNRRC